MPDLKYFASKEDRNAWYREYRKTRKQKLSRYYKQYRKKIKAKRPVHNSLDGYCESAILNTTKSNNNNQHNNDERQPD